MITLVHFDHISDFKAHCIILLPFCVTPRHIQRRAFRGVDCQSFHCLFLSPWFSYASCSPDSLDAARAVVNIRDDAGCTRLTHCCVTGDCPLHINRFPPVLPSLLNQVPRRVADKPAVTDRRVTQPCCPAFFAELTADKRRVIHDSAPCVRPVQMTETSEVAFLPPGGFVPRDGPFLMRLSVPIYQGQAPQHQRGLGS